jgi:hypothetical protein
MKIYIVGWFYEGGGGFNWFVNEQDANAAWIKEKANTETPSLKSSGWTCYRNTAETELNPSTDAEAITNEIDSNLSHYEDSAVETYGPLRYDQNGLLVNKEG